MSDYYQSDETSAGNPPGDGEGMDDKGMEKEDSGGETALLPKSILAGKEFNPGDELVLKVVRLYDDEVEVAYATGKDEKNPMKKSAMDEASDKLGMMG
jgi:hypothetical protein